MEMPDPGSETSSQADSANGRETEPETQGSGQGDVRESNVQEMTTKFKEVDIDDPEDEDPHDTRSALEKLLDKKTLPREERLPPLQPENKKLKREKRRRRYQEDLDHLRNSLPQMLDPRALAPAQRPDTITAADYLNLTKFVQKPMWYTIPGCTYKPLHWDVNRAFLTDEDVENLICAFQMTDISNNTDTLLTHFRDIFRIMESRRDTYCATDANMKLYFYASVRMEYYNSLLRGRGNLKKLKMAQGIAALRVTTMMKVIDFFVITRGETILQRSFREAAEKDIPRHTPIPGISAFGSNSNSFWTYVEPPDWEDFSHELHREPKADTKVGQDFLTAVDNWIEVLREKERHMTVFREHFGPCRPFDFDLSAGSASTSRSSSGSLMDMSLLSINDVDDIPDTDITSSETAVANTASFYGGPGVFGGVGPSTAGSSSGPEPVWTQGGTRIYGGSGLFGGPGVFAGLAASHGG
jgi:hypothetical protein